MKDRFFRKPFDYFFGRTIEDFVRYEQYDSPLANVLEYESHYEIEVAAPGMTRKNIRVEIAGGVLNVVAQRMEAARRGHRVGTLEFRTTAFQRSFVLPKLADPNHVQAKCKNGLLVIRMEKQHDPDRQKSRTIYVSEERQSPALSGWKRLRSFLRQLYQHLIKPKQK